MPTCVLFFSFTFNVEIPAEAVVELSRYAMCGRLPLNGWGWGTHEVREIGTSRIQGSLVFGAYFMLWLSVSERG
jgi:hypothetical protein